MSVLAVFMEPAPYKVGLIRELRNTYRGNLEIVFIGKSMTQPWNATLDNLRAQYLPEETWAAMRDIRERLRRSNPGIIHLAGWGHPVLMRSLLLGRLLGIPVVADTDTPAPPEERAWKRLAKRAAYPTLFRIPRMFLPSGTRQASYLKKYGVPDERIRIGRMTSDVDGIQKYVSGLGLSFRGDFLKRHGVAEKAQTIFLYLGRLEDFKGLQDLFDAYLKLRAERDDVALLVAGGGSLAPMVRAMASAVRSIHYLGHLTGERVWEAYAAADVLVLPSRFEPWGLVVNEAMAAGLPVIASDIVGCGDDLIHEGVTGLVVPSRSPAALCSAMSELAGRPELRSRMGARARVLISGWTLADQARIMIAAWGSILT